MKANHGKRTAALIALFLALMMTLNACVFMVKDQGREQVETKEIRESTEEEEIDLSSESEIYNKAIAALEAGDLGKARGLFYKIPEYKDARDRYCSIEAKWQKEYQPGDWGYTKTYTYDGQGKPLMSALSSPGSSTTGTTEWLYDEWGNLITIKHSSFQHQQSYYGDSSDSYETWYVYDEQGRMIQEHDYDGDFNEYEILYEYDAGGNLIRSTKDSTRITEYSYDDAGRLIRETITYGFAPDYIDYTYDSEGHLIQKSHFNTYYQSSGLIYAATYDEKGRLVKEYEAEGEWDINTEYDAFGNRVKKTVALNGIDPVATEYFYDDQGLLVKSVEGGREDQTFEYSDYVFFLRSAS